MRNHFLFLGLTALAGAAFVACSGDDATNPSNPPSDADAGADADATATDAGPDDAQVTYSDAGPDGPSLVDGGDAGPPDTSSGDDAGDADVPDANDGAAPGHASTQIASGTQALGVTSDGYVIYWVQNDDAGTGPGHHATEGTIAAVSAAGGQPQILSTTVTIDPDMPTVAVAGATAAWLDETGANAGGCALSGHALRTWSSAHGVSLIAPFAVGSSVDSLTFVTTPRMSSDGSKIAYAPTCTAVDGGTVLPTLALAATDGTSAPLTAALTPAPSLVLPFVNGGVVTLEESELDQVVLGGNPLAVVPAGGSVSPNGVWSWTYTPAGGQLVLVENGSVVFTDPTVSTASVGQASLWDGTGANLFYVSSTGLKQIALANPTATTALAGTCGGLFAVAPNGGAVLCENAGEDGGTVFHAVTAGAASAEIAIPVSGPVQFLPDSTLVWMNGATLYSEPVLGGAVSTLLASVQGFIESVGGSQVAVVSETGTLSIVDATGKVPTFALAPQESVNAIVAGGGFVAYAAPVSGGGGIFAVKVN